MRQYMITVFIIVITAIGGFMLPSKLLQWQDQLRLESAGAQETEEVILAARTDMTLIEKMQLIQKSSATAVSMEQGKNYTRDSIIDKAESELQKLTELEILNLDNEDCVYGISEILFFVDTENGTKSMILWSITRVSEKFFIKFDMDDETGKILSIKQLTYINVESPWPDESDEFFSSILYSGELEAAAEKWGEYLGIALTEVYDTQNPAEDIDKVKEREIAALIKEGASKEQATQRVYETWENQEEKSEHWLYGVYEDESGSVAYLFRKNTELVVFSAKFYI